MTRVDFYTGSPDKLRTVCQLSHKAIQNGIRAVISTSDPALFDTLDKLLWHFPATGFIPHCDCDSSDAERMPVVLNRGSDKFPHHELLINLHTECMPFFSRFERVIEIVAADEEDSRTGRERYKFYKDRGYELRHFDLTTLRNI